MSNLPKQLYAQIAADYAEGGITLVRDGGQSLPWRTLPVWMLTTMRPLPGTEGRDWRPCCCRTADGECHFYRLGETLIVPRNLPHRFENPNRQGGISVWCHFSVWQAPGIDAFRRLEQPLVVGGAASVRIAAATRRLVELHRDGPMDLAANCKARASLFDLAAIIAEQAGFPLESGPEQEEEVEFWPLLAYIQKHLHQRLPLAELAGRMHRSPSSFRDSFCRIFGMPPGRYILHARLALGASLLRQRTQAVGEIAVMTGFSDAFSFSKAFRKHFGMAPRDYRSAPLN